MAITYRNLRELLIDKKVQLKDLHNNVGVSWGTIAKINKDEYIALNILEKIAIYLETDIGDLVEIKK